MFAAAKVGIAAKNDVAKTTAGITANSPPIFCFI
jgi:hypothetical protein